MSVIGTSHDQEWPRPRRQWWHRVSPRPLARATHRSGGLASLHEPNASAGLIPVLRGIAASVSLLGCPSLPARCFFGPSRRLSSTSAWCPQFMSLPPHPSRNSRLNSPSIRSIRSMPIIAFRTPPEIDKDLIPPLRIDPPTDSNIPTP